MVNIKIPFRTIIREALLLAMTNFRNISKLTIALPALAISDFFWAFGNKVRNGKSEIMDFDPVWARIKSNSELKTFIDLAQAVNVLQSAVSKRRKSGKFPAEWIFVIAEKYHLSSDYLAWGASSNVHADTQTTAIPAVKETSDQSSPEDDGPESATSEERFSMAEVLEQTQFVLESDTEYRSALLSNIRAFHKSVILEVEKLEMNEYLQRMEAKHDADMKELKALIMAISNKKEGGQEDEKKSQAA